MVISVFVSNLIMFPFMYIMEYIFDCVPGNLNGQILGEALPMLVVCILMSGFLAIVPLYFGMRKKKSTARMIITSIVVVNLACSSFGSLMSMGEYMIRVLILGVIAMCSILMTMKYTLDNVDNIEVD